MEKMRCHKSSIVIKSIHQMSFWFLALIYGIVSAIAEGSDEPLMEIDDKPVALPVIILISVVIFIGIFVILLIFNYVRWRKTILYIENENFIEEKNLLMKRKKTVKLSSIATVNLQQNLFERIFRVYHLKFDINSSATANETDFDLIFDKETALWLKRTLLQETESESIHEEQSDVEGKPQLEETSISFGFFEVIRHSVFCLSMGSIVLFVIGLVFTVMSAFYEVSFEDDGNIVVSFLFMAIPAVWGVIKRFVDYQGYTFTKCGDNYHLQYGLLTKREYDLNCSRASAVIIKEPLIARIFGYCYGEIVNVGLGDEANTAESPVFCLCVKKEKIYQLLGEILPDYEPDASFKPMSRKSQFLINPFLVCFFIGLPIGLIVAGAPVWLFVITPAYVVLALFLRFLTIRTSGMGMQSEYVTIVNGAFDKTTYITQFGKIQRMQIMDSIVTKPLGIAKGNVWILASLTKSIISLPYMERGWIEKLSDEMLAHENRLRL